jgi:hypothetical protein
MFAVPPGRFIEFGKKQKFPGEIFDIASAMARRVTAKDGGSQK